jgi:hypothetical protein
VRRARPGRPLPVLPEGTSLTIIPIAQRRRVAIPADLSPEERFDYLVRLRDLWDMADLAAEQEQLAAQEALDYRWSKKVEGYFLDPVAWAHDCIAWPKDKGLTPYQEECLSSMVEHGRAAVRGPHGLGKTCMESLAVLWFSITRDAAGADWKIPTTASVWEQLKNFLWPEIHKWARLLRWDVIGRDPFDPRRELLQWNLKLRFGAAFAISPDDPAHLEGAHADELLYVYDESKAVSDATFDASEGAFSTAGKEDGTNAYALAVSTPGEPVGRFYEIHSRRPGTHDWWVRHVTVEECIAAGRVTAEWVNNRGLLWGPQSAIYKNRVLGEFASASTDGVIPLGWVEAANQRWRLLYEPNGEPVGAHRDPQEGTRAVLKPGEKCHTIGVDVALGGEDSTVLAFRQGNNIVELRRDAFTDDTTVISDKVSAIQEAHGLPLAIVDAIGVGAGVFNEIRRLGTPCHPFIASQATKRHDLSGEFGFANLRSWAWWNLREMLDPTNGMDLALPPDDRLTGDLLAPKYREVSGARIQVESKDDIRKRINRSTDDGDAVVMAYSRSGGSWASLYAAEPEEEEEDDGIPKPTQKPSRSGGWGSVYAKADTNGAEPAEAEPAPALPAAREPAPKPAPVSGYFAGSQAPEKRVEKSGPIATAGPVDDRALARPCRCGNFRRDHAGDQHLGRCLGDDGTCPCQRFEAPL